MQLVRGLLLSNKPSSAILKRISVRKEPAIALALRSIHSSAIPRKEFKLTDIGEGIVQVEVLKWFVKPGDKVKEFDRLVEVQSDKATVEITSRFHGTIKSLAVEEGKMAKVGQVLVVFESDDAKQESAPVKPVLPSFTTPATTKASSPPPPKVPMTVTSSSSADKEVEVADVDSEAAIALATPAVRHLARENKVDLRKVKGTGRDGRVLKGDVLAYLDKHESGSEAPSVSAVPVALRSSSPSPPPATSTIKEPIRSTSKGTVQVVPITGIRREMGKPPFDFNISGLIIHGFYKLTRMVDSENDDCRAEDSSHGVHG